MRRDKFLPPQLSEYPQVSPVPAMASRPLWSVMIPAYNCGQYLIETLRSVLDQDPGPEVMQIEVVDDCSTQDDSEAVVKSLGKGRVSFFRQSRNVGISSNFTTCVRRAHGSLVHILHSDDIVRPGFYSRMQEAFNGEPSLGAAFCRHIYMDEDGHWQFLSLLERRAPGVLVDWLEQLAVSQRIQAPAIVVRRKVYEELGGFHPGLFHAGDWDMWKRVAALYPVWYEPSPLACYRVHASSDTSKLNRSGGNYANTRKAIEAARAYLPETIAEEVSRKSYEHYAISALSAARRSLISHDPAAAVALIREAFRCSRSARTIGALIRLGLWSIRAGARATIRRPS